MKDVKFHVFSNDISNIKLPPKFTFPFCYTPHELCILAKNEVMSFLSTRYDWQKSLSEGKMFGVLVVKNNKDEIGFLASFSGIFNGTNNIEYFVPPIYDLLTPNGFFKTGEKKLLEFSNKILSLQQSEKYIFLKNKIVELEKNSNKEIEKYKNFMLESKKNREFLRSQCISKSQSQELITQSQFQKAELKRIKQRWAAEINNTKAKFETILKEIDNLKAERKAFSIQLQKKLFEKFVILNALGQSKNLLEIFAPLPQQIPPSGAGDCAAPKLLQYAYNQQYKPIAMAEFWLGKSPTGIIRRHGNFYPACIAKCRPILNFMLTGLDVEPDPMLANKKLKIEIVYDDNYLAVINKPAGLQSVPGKLDVDCVFYQAKRLFSDVENLFIEHRLDMATSGLLIIAKSKEIYQSLQVQFKNRLIKKRYIALLDGKLKTTKGKIDLPICCNPNDRPRQIVDYTYGKPAITFFEVSDFINGFTRVVFHPLTGRTHQLRVHAAHPNGLNCPIVGDMLYGRAADRMFLHAESIKFTHPVFLREICVEKKADF